MYVCVCIGNICMYIYMHLFSWSDLTEPSTKTAVKLLGPDPIPIPFRPLPSACPACHLPITQRCHKRQCKYVCPAISSKSAHYNNDNSNINTSVFYIYAHTHIYRSAVDATPTEANDYRQRQRQRQRGSAAAVAVAATIFRL